MMLPVTVPSFNRLPQNVEINATKQVCGAFQNSGILPLIFLNAMFRGNPELLTRGVAYVRYAFTQYYVNRCASCLLFVRHSVVFLPPPCVFFVVASRLCLCVCFFLSPVFFYFYIPSTAAYCMCHVICLCLISYVLTTLSVSDFVCIRYLCVSILCAHLFFLVGRFYSPAQLARGLPSATFWASHAVVTGVFPPPPDSCVHFYRASGSTFIPAFQVFVLVDFCIEFHQLTPSMMCVSMIVCVHGFVRP